MLASFLACLSPLGKKRERIPEQLLAPQRLYAGTERLDLKRVRKLILSKKLAPCYPGVEEARTGQEVRGSHGNLHSTSGSNYYYYFMRGSWASTLTTWLWLLMPAA